jgi:hypothetical protein
MRTPSHQRPEAPDIHFAWRVRLRWLVWLALLLLTAWATLGLDTRLPLAWVLAVLALGFGSNGAAWAWRRHGRVTEGSLLARTLAEQLGGHLSFESKAGAGTVARFTVPRSEGGAS